MDILFLCGREVQYPLNQFLLQSFRQFARVDVIEESGSGKSILKRSAQVLAQVPAQLRRKKYDLVFVGFFGHFLMPPLRALTRAPILFHPFISTFETLVYDRKKAAPASLTAQLAFGLDRTAMHAASHLLMDTQANVTYFSQTFGLPESRSSIIYIGSDETLFYPRPEKKPTGEKIILYHGSYLPLQGVDTIIQAAKLLDNEPNLRFRLLGNGLEYERIRKLVTDLRIHNVDFLSAVPVSELPEQIACASICLGGHFGTSDKAARVIAGKTFQDIAMGKATIVGNNSANRELLRHGYDAWFTPMDDPCALAESIRTLVSDPFLREEIGRNAHHTFLEKGSLKVIHPQVQKVVEQVIAAPD
jgi:glycosyltransferase involved in cell wall biosynthesis